MPGRGREVSRMVSRRLNCWYRHLNHRGIFLLQFNWWCRYCTLLYAGYPQECRKLGILREMQRSSGVF